MKTVSKLLTVLAGAVMALSFSVGTYVSASTQSYGPDWSKYQGSYGKYGTSKDQFVIAQVGGTYGGYYVDQPTYRTQVASAIAAGKRAHTYIWYQVGGSTSLANAALSRFLPRVQTPKGSIVALDYEAGASSSKQANTNAILYGMNRIKAAGYTPVLYSGKYYLAEHTYYNQINSAYPTSLWLAGYPMRGVQTLAPFRYFPSMDGVALWQFTDNYGTTGLDGSVDLTGITHKGYDGSYKTVTGKVVVKPKTTSTAIKAGQKANSTPKSALKAGMTVKVNLSAKRWATGQAMPSFVKGHTYTIKQVSGNRVLLSGVMSWANKSDVELLGVKTPVTVSYVTNYAQRGVFKPRYTVNVRTGMGTNYRITGHIGYGAQVLYVHVYIKGGLVWAQYHSYSGLRYVAMGKMGGQSYATRTVY